MLATFKTETDLLTFYSEAKGILSNGGFNLREWSSNSVKLNTSIEISDANRSKIVKTLGIPWLVEDDKIEIKPFVPEKTRTVAKRQVVSSLSKTYDPFGLLLPVTVSGKLFIQKLWSLRLGWDENIPEELYAEWCTLVANLRNLSVTIDRKFSNQINPSLHIYADSSKACYGCVAYFVDGDSHSFILAKSRVAPLVPPSLPQMELTAVNIAAQLGKFLIMNFKDVDIKETILFTDSTIVVEWLTGKSYNKKAYVKNRIENIKQLCPNAKIAHVPGVHNPADLLTRGISAKEFLKSDKWLNGPELASVNAVNIRPDNNSDSLLTEAVCNVSDSEMGEPIINVSRYSSYSKALRITCYVLRFINKSRRKNIDSQIQLTIREFRNAEITLVKLYQTPYIPDIMSYFSSKRGRVPNLVNQLNLKRDDGILRCHGRLENSTLSNDMKYPILIPSKCSLTDLIVHYSHLLTLHAGMDDVLAHLRGRWWIPRGRLVVKSIIKKCITCKKVSGRPYTPPAMPPLPGGRVIQAKPFSVCGLDYTGAISIKNDGSGVNKAYICLFTCIVTRAVHLEVVYSLSEEDFIRALTKFSSRRSYPSVMYSDNASNFMSAYKSLRDLSNSKIVSEFLNNKLISWKFITPRAAWHGGCWERLIGMTKDCFKKCVGKNLMHKSDLETIVIQIEMKLNDRPFTYVSNEINEILPLTSAHLLYGFKLNEFPVQFRLI